MADYNSMSDEEISALVVETLGDEYETYQKVSAELSEESPRASVIVGAAWLDFKLASLIEQALHDDERVRKVFTNPFRYFGSRIDVAYRLGLISQQEKEGLEVVRDIRNEFAHEILVSFSDSKIKELVPKLEPFVHQDAKPMEDPRHWYVYAVSYLNGLLSVRVKSAREEPNIATRLDMLRFVAKENEEVLEEIEVKDKG